MGIQIRIALGKQHRQTIRTLNQGHQYRRFTQAAGPVVHTGFIGQFGFPRRWRKQTMPDEIRSHARRGEGGVAAIGLDDR
ncbi:hypothetical protein Cmtc_04090 [Cupriavidus sp. TKC]|nr:hypothetical protein Cmtc_04090 [Cupriavidus sp. TKC]